MTVPCAVAILSLPGALITLPDGATALDGAAVVLVVALLALRTPSITPTDAITASAVENFGAIATMLAHGAPTSAADDATTSFSGATLTAKYATFAANDATLTDHNQ